MLKELGGHDGANRVTPPVFRSGGTTAVPIEAGEGLKAARLQLSTQHISLDHWTSIADERRSQLVCRGRTKVGHNGIREHRGLRPWKALFRHSSSTSWSGLDPIHVRTGKFKTCGEHHARSSRSGKTPSMPDFSRAGSSLVAEDSSRSRSLGSSSFEITDEIRLSVRVIEFTGSPSSWWRCPEVRMFPERPAALSRRRNVCSRKRTP
jgi:hypothetical protein